VATARKFLALSALGSSHPRDFPAKDRHLRNLRIREAGAMSAHLILLNQRVLK